MHSSLPLRLRFTYTGLLLLVWQGEAAFFAVAALWLLCFGAEQYFALQMRLAWAVRQVRPIVVSQEYPGDPRTRSTANEIRDLLIRAGNENLVQRDSKGKVLVVLVYEIYFQDEENIREAWQQYAERVEQRKAELWSKRLAFYKKNNHDWALAYWHQQTDAHFFSPKPATDSVAWQ